VLARMPILLALANRSSTRYEIRRTDGKSRTTISGEPSVEALSTTKTSIGKRQAPFDKLSRHWAK